MARNEPLLGLELATKRGAAKALKRAMKMVEARMKQNASETDHSLEDLRKLGHPYSAAHPKSIHDPDYLIHSQNGDLERAITSKQVNQYRAVVGVDDNAAPHAVHVIFGTKHMVARDFVTNSANEIKDEIMEVFEEEIAKELK